MKAGSRFQFPPLATATPDGILCIGGNLSPGMLLSAYAQGIFPWFNDEDPLLWWSPDPRFIVDPTQTHLSGTMRKLLRKQPFHLTLDTAFDRVISACATRARPGQQGTWICQDMIQAYHELHRLGYAHSAEAWQGEHLVGGLYGINLGMAFFGESMFSLADDASKAVFLPLAWWLAERGFRLIDSQVHTDHVESLGGFAVSRAEYLLRLQTCLTEPTQPGNWSAQWPEYPYSARYRTLLTKTG
ncbi:MAG: leucyl/phenylalanyl-tRNA--protein transferase [Spirochaetes bacterium GWD1_61_31]|nr:MAG: leucyl/phenylalanyl-tRNA--protein transferase [Spirochaetes bacterium GWB1_60_80]OHD34938.1 MAG: leucyl/phenylalanyl-tRNA--protein transferase [Spirochaetes bacterium GWC1_61_12]OHD37094.1 MAG: leucyl/phenylalanyl-tRNA--protein transferase [Spirochaetes bacterium GWD1_61_31]OHD44671.1 MAG: leucyl/phenylalanyl-tRNA--protein transferase [Spirochaetes bacterium GWE1_60_18]OHD61108.1 MAG: leucyl/phenylalanyl-tRNA--protein transferase [Spirochaetes bacterium GWF1_60_12]